MGSRAAREAWDEAMASRAWQREISVNPLGRALAALGSAMRAEAEAEIAGLRAEMDRAGGHDVYVCMHRDRELMAAQLPGVRAGTRLRFTDRDGALELDEDGQWREMA